MDHAQKQVAFTSVDRAMSERLNGERNVQRSSCRAESLFH